jgi:hypothetical protein
LSRGQSLACNATAFYGFLPAFYVNAIFINFDIWIGGKPKTNFVRIVIERKERDGALPYELLEEGRRR